VSGREHHYFAPCTLGLEEVLAGELRELGASDIRPGRGGVAFAGDVRLGYAANLWCRTAVRIQRRLLEGPAADPEELYRLVGRVDWAERMTVDQTLAFDASVRDSGITHSRFAAQRAKDAIVDQFRERTGRRPSVDTKDPDLPLKLLIRKDRATLDLNLSGPSLHKRGWRPIQVKSPLNEALAAGLLLLSGWDRRSPLVDPMCGSGTFLVEAALMATDRAPGLSRDFAFERWPDLEAKVWRGLLDEARERARDDLPFVLEGADRHGGALALARKGAKAAGVERLVRFTRGDARDFRPENDARFVVTNPPWGERLGEGEDLKESWRALGNFLHERMGGGEAWVLSGNPQLPRLLGLKADRRIPVKAGPVDCRWLRYPVRRRPGQSNPSDRRPV
jgi:putative N6-adenine-specific DNA methylase